MKKYAPIVIMICAAVTVIFSFIGDDSYAGLVRLRKSLEAQKKKNYDARQHVTALKRKVYGLQNDDRVLEQAARNELGMARHGELIFIFDNYIDE